MHREYGRWNAWVLCTLWLLVIFGHSLMPQNLSRQESETLLSRLAGMFPFLTHFLLRKIAHFTEFAVLGVLLTRCFRMGPVRSLFAGLLCALFDETVQLFVPGRGSQVRDVWVDFAGVTFAVGVTVLIRYLRRRKKRAQTP